MGKKTPFRLTEKEMAFALAYYRGKDRLVAYREAYPENSAPDNRARYKAKEILNRPNVSAYLDWLKESEDLTENITEDAIKKYLWETALENKGTQVGLRAAQTLGKEFGIGNETVTVKHEQDYDVMLDQIFEYNEKLRQGLNPPMPTCLIENADTVESEVAEFTMVDDEDEDE